MPVRKVQGGYRWGQSGKVYPTKAQAERQGRAIHASGYQDGGIVDVSQDEGMLGRLQNFFTEQARRKTEREMMNEEARRLVMEKYAPSYGQLANFGAMLLPTAGTIDAEGSWPSIGAKDQPFSEAFSNAPYPSMAENLQRGGWGGYFDAGMQGLGVVGDALWAVPAVGPLVGAAVGTPLKTVSAVGRAARGSRGIAALEEARKIDVDTFARDESGFFSPTIRALIEQAPPDLKGQGIVDWARANANKGVKPKELEFLGLDEFVAANPNATTREAVEGISGNRVRVRQNVRSGEGEALDFERTIPETDPLDGSSLWQDRVDDLKYELEQGDEFTKKQLLDHHKEEVRNQWYRLPGGIKRQRSLQEEQRFYDENNYFKSLDDMPQSAIDDIVESFAETEYFQNPYEMLTPQGEQFGPAYGDFAFGNEETGYQLFVNGERVTDPDNIAYSRTEAEVQLQQKLGLEDYGGTEFKQYVDESLPGGENYREVVFNWDNAPQTHNIGHFDDENQIAHALVRDRTLDDGTSSLHIDELQSDLHTKGSREGYQLPEKLRIEEVNKIEGVLEGTEITMKPPEPLRVPDSTTPSGWRIEHRVHPDAAGKSIFVPLHDPEIASIIGNDIGIGAFPLYQIEGLARELKAGRTSRFGSEAADSLVESLGAEKIYELADLVKPLAEAGPVPDYPFKDNWYEMVLKNLLLDAAREGKPALSVSGSAPIKARYSDEYSKFYEMLYDRKVPSFMKKLANRYGGEFEQGSLDLVDTYGSRNLRGSEVPDFATDNMEANIIRITPEMRARILEEGIPSFGGGGIVDVTQGTDPSTVDRVMRFMNESKAPVPQLGGFNRVALPPEEPKLTPAQAAYIAAQLEPTVITGAADILGGYPEFPSRDVPLSQAFSGEPMPSLIENVREGNLGIAALQSLGAIPGIGAIARAARAGRAVKRSDIVDELIEASYGSQREGIESLARLQRMPESVPLDTYLASQAPSRKIRKKGKTHPARLLRQEVARKRELRRRNPPEVRLYRDLPGRLKDFKIERTARNFTENHPNAQYWYKPDREQIFSDMQDWHHQKTKYNPYPWPEHKQSIKRANLKGLVRKFKKEGWEVDHVSREQGRVSSYYVKKDGNMIRISGHELPMTPQREYDRSRGLTGIWDDEIIVSSDTNIDDVYAETKRLVADWAE